MFGDSTCGDVTIYLAFLLRARKYRTYLILYTLGASKAEPCPVNTYRMTKGGVSQNDCLVSFSCLLSLLDKVASFRT